MFAIVHINPHLCDGKYLFIHCVQHVSATDLIESTMSAAATVAHNESTILSDTQDSKHSMSVPKCIRNSTEAVTPEPAAQAQDMKNPSLVRTAPAAQP